jgi:biotin-dependent carboxylase-like uncharacterized protein
MIRVVDPGPLATVQDLGRVGYAHLGVSRSGAFDRPALAAANRLVGNSEAAAGIETTFGGLHLRFVHAATVAVTGAPCPGCDAGVAVTLPAGAELRLGAPVAGVRSYLAVRGGIGVPPVLGSRSTDTLSGLGPAPLAARDELPIGATPASPVSGDQVAPRPRPEAVPVVVGPRADWFRPDALRCLLDSVWAVQPDSDRVGVRLDGPALARARDDELPSEPTLPGALQVPPDGHPILLGPDAPVTGGYPVIAVVRSANLGAVAQLRPGDELRFTTAR